MLLHVAGQVVVRCSTVLARIKQLPSLLWLPALVGVQTADPIASLTDAEVTTRKAPVVWS